MQEKYLKHRGTPHEGMTPHSGRHPWGSGDNPYAHSQDFLARVDELEKKYRKPNGAVDQVKVAKELGISTTELRDQKSIAKEKRKADLVKRAIYLKETRQYSNNKAAKIMGINESSFRQLLRDHEKENTNKNQKVADILEKELKSKKYVDVGKNSGLELGIKDTRLQKGLDILKEKGYVVEIVHIEQAGNPGKYTTLKVLAPEGTTKHDIYLHKDDVKPLGTFYSRDNGDSYGHIEKPQSISSSRIKINYAEDGGASKDGVIELRRGVEDLSLGNSKYAQVRIAVDGTNYLKGMAMYSDNIPKGYDIVFNTNKHKDTPMIAEKDGDPEVLKRMKDDPDNPFGALIDHAKGQSHYTGKDGKDHLSAINKVKEEGAWNDWSRSIAAQFLSKQPIGLAKQQLKVTYADKKAQLDDINKLTNPEIKKKLLEDFANDCDSSAVHLKAAALPRSQWQVILPVPDLKDNEIYASNYKQGEEVALIRYPHGGTFEIPKLIVNNRSKAAKAVMENASDAVGINSNVAQRLSGADFDGDTVLVIPTKTANVKATSPLEKLKGFEPSESYPGYPGMKVISESYKQKQMGIVSNLITDMTLKGAKEEELARAVKHSMVIIDAKKHKLDWKASEAQNGIAALKKKYQPKGGASTLISLAKSEKRVNARQGNPKIDPETGKLIYKESGASYINKKGETIIRQQKSTQMAETDNALSLSSGTRMENLYAEYANSLKALANTARKEMISTKTIPYSPTAKKTYEKEVQSLDAKLNNALKNDPKERRAQLIANSIYDKKRKIAQEDGEWDRMTNKDKRKIKTEALNVARAQTGAIGRKDRNIDITDREWEAIQAHAISANKLKQIINHTDMDDLKKRATPRQVGMTASQEARAKALLRMGYTQQEVASRIGVSASSVSKISASM